MLSTVFFNQSLNSTLIEALMVSTSNYEMRGSLFLGIDASFNLKFRIAKKRLVLQNRTNKRNNSNKCPKRFLYTPIGTPGMAVQRSAQGASTAMSIGRTRCTAVRSPAASAARPPISTYPSSENETEAGRLNPARSYSPVSRPISC